MYQVKENSRLRWISLGFVLVLAVAVAALLAPTDPFFADANAQVRRLSVEQVEEAAHALGMHWQGTEDEAPIVVDFGGTSATDDVAGLDQWLAARSGAASAAPAVPSVTGPQKVVVLRVYFNDYANNSLFTKNEVENLFDRLDQLWQDTSYGKISIDYEVSDLFQLPDNRSAYIDDGDGWIDVNGDGDYDPGVDNSDGDNDGTEGTPCAVTSTGDLSCDGKYQKVLDDAVAECRDQSPDCVDFTDADAVFVLMAETDPNQFHRGLANKCALPIGSGGANRTVGCAIFSENPSENDDRRWGRWAHEMGHAFQQAGPTHPSNYNSPFELMDNLLPGQTGAFEKLDDMGFPDWLPQSKYIEIDSSNDGEQLCLYAVEYSPGDRPNPQAIKAKITDSFYYMISVRRRVNGDELWPIPDEGVLIERVVEDAKQWVTVQGNGARNRLWDEGDTYTNSADGIEIAVGKRADDDSWCVTVFFNKQANQPDVAMHPWTSPPGNTWETTDIWVDSPVNGYDTYRYGQWNDLWGNPVPRGNGDDPAVGLTNRLYARVRNVGTQTATDVVVNWEITDPPGVGINGANGWAPIGSVDKNDFPALASIDPGDYVDVYVEWTPNFPISEEDLEAGRFHFHTCVRVQIDTVAGETVTANQDGNREQENINYFQAVGDGGDSTIFDSYITLRNDFNEPRFYYLSHESDLPDDWILNINNGQQGVKLDANEVRKIPVLIKPQGQAAIGSVFGVDVRASYLELLVNDEDPNDIHPADMTLSGARVEARVLQQPKIECRATDKGEIEVVGKLSNFEEFYDEKNPLKVMIQGLDGSRRYVQGSNSQGSAVVDVQSDGSFRGFLYSEKPHIEEVVCLFAGTEKLASAGTGYVPVASSGESPLPTPTREPEPTWTPVPTDTPTPGPTPTPTPQAFFIPFQPPIAEIEQPVLGSTDLGLHGIEITQGIQCFDTSKGLADCPDNSLPVVTGKSTAARVYISFSNTLFNSRNNVPVRLFMRKDGGAWQSIDAAGKGLPQIDQSEAENSANFFFTINGSSPVVVDFYAVVDPNDVIPEINEANNRYPSSGYVTMTFHPRAGLEIVGQRLRYDPPGNGDPLTAGDGAGSGTSGWTVNSGSALWFNQLLPISDGGVTYSVASGFRDWTSRLHFVTRPDPTAAQGQHSLIQQMNGEYVLALIFALVFGGDADDLVDHAYGWIPNDFGAFGHADMPVYPHAGGLGVVGIGTDDPGNSTDNPGPGALIFGHELVHDYDVFHTNTGADDCGSDDGSSDFPYATSSIQEYGFNPLTQKVYKPEDTHDLMSYCPSAGSKEGWISPFTWQRMFDALTVSAASRSLDGESIRLGYGGPRLSRTNHSFSLLIDLTVFNPEQSDRSGGQLNEMYKVDRGYNLVLPEGDYAVEMRDASGQVLASRSFSVDFQSEYSQNGAGQSGHSHEGHAHGRTPGEQPAPGDPDPADQANLTFVMPWAEGTSEIVLLHGGQVLDRRAVSAAAPAVTITSPSTKVEWNSGQQTLQWTATDQDTDASDLSYAVFFSNDGGKNWELLQDGIKGTAYTVDVDAMAGGSDTRFRVLVTDGINTAYDETDAPIVIPNKAPTPSIIEPANSTIHLPGALVVLQGGASDLEDGTIPANQLQWSSDVQGPLGVGTSVPLTTLAPGSHTITLRALDSNGVPGETSVDVLVGYGIYLPSLSK